MPMAIIEQEIIHAVKRLLSENNTEHRDVINQELGSPEGFAVLQRIAREEAQKAVKQLRERHLLIEAAAQATANAESEISEKARTLLGRLK
jgi:hypothetical protein